MIQFDGSHIFQLGWWKTTNQKQTTRHFFPSGPPKLQASSSAFAIRRRQTKATKLWRWHRGWWTWHPWHPSPWRGRNSATVWGEVWGTLEDHPIDFVSFFWITTPIYKSWFWPFANPMTCKDGSKRYCFESWMAVLLTIVAKIVTRWARWHRISSMNNINNVLETW